MSDLDRLRERCLARLRGLRIPRPFDVALLCERVADSRGRPIRLLPMAMPGAGLFGLWIAAEGCDYIVYERSTSRLHQEHIIVHELAHVLCQHETGPNAGTEHAGRLFDRLDVATVRSVLARSAAYSTGEEQEAEMIASLVLEQADRGSAPDPRVTDPALAAIRVRLESSLGGQPAEADA